MDNTSSFLEGCRNAPSYLTDAFAREALEAVKRCLLTEEGRKIIEERIKINREQRRRNEEAKRGCTTDIGSV